MQARQVYWMLIAASALPLVACGGSGTQVASTPTPTPSTTPPTPPPAQPPVKIFPNPIAGDFTSVGSSVPASGDVPFYYGNKDARFGTISTATSDQPSFRYSPNGYYEVQLPGLAFERLVHQKSNSNPDPNNTAFQPATSNGWVVTNGSAQSGYSYSELASWAGSGRFGYVAFGRATPAGSVPVTGTANFIGVSRGSADIMLFDQLAGSYFAADVFGEVKLNFDFGAGTLTGSMSLSLGDGMQPLPIDTFAFRNTVFSVGSTTYSGSFDTTATGQNSFLGRFTGPNADETIGAWVVPFVFSRSGTYIQADGQTHQAMGAWIAKRGD